MTKNIKEYIKRIGFDGLPGISLADVPQCLGMACGEGVSELIVDENEFTSIRTYLIHSGAWNWDGKTFMGIKILICKN